MPNIETMKREEIVMELARYSHPTWYHDLLVFPTRYLKALLTFYRSA